MTLKGKKVLVTGAGGFIGSHLAERLVELGANVRAFIHYNSRGSLGWLESSESRPEIDFALGDLADAGTVRAAVSDREIVFHLGALIAIPYSYVAPASYVQVNVAGTTNLLSAAVTEGVERVVHTSTSEVYGTATKIPMSEEHLLNAQSPYAASKTGADQIALAFVHSYGLPVVTIRPFNTYGPRQSARAIIPTLISQCLFADKVKVGNLTPTRDFTFVSDTVDGFIRAATAEGVSGATLNLGSGTEISIAALAEVIASQTGRELSLDQEPDRMRAQGSEVEQLCSDNSKARRMLSWQPSISLEDGIGLTIDWIKAHPEHFPVELYSI